MLLGKAGLQNAKRVTLSLSTRFWTAPGYRGACDSVEIAEELNDVNYAEIAEETYKRGSTDISLFTNPIASQSGSEAKPPIIAKDFVSRYYYVN